MEPKASLPGTSLITQAVLPAPRTLGISLSVVNGQMKLLELTKDRIHEILHLFSLILLLLKTRP